MKELLETGVHFGHRTRKWNPKMARYIFTQRKGIHIIDLEQTVEMFKKAYYFTRDRVGEGGEVLFVGTKKQVQSTIADEAQRCGAHYINRRWLGGTLTNFVTIRRSIDRMKKYEAMIEDGTVDHMPNKEASKLRRELVKLHRNLNGVRNMERKPEVVYVIDPDVEVNAVREANIIKIPVIAIVDTNCDPDPIDFLVPGNDDAIKATKLITSRIADAVIEGNEGKQGDSETPATADAVVEDVPAATADAVVDDPSEATAEVVAKDVSEVTTAVVTDETAAEAEPGAKKAKATADAVVKDLPKATADAVVKDAPKATAEAIVDDLPAATAAADVLPEKGATLSVTEDIPETKKAPAKAKKTSATKTKKAPAKAKTKKTPAKSEAAADAKDADVPARKKPSATKEKPVKKPADESAKDAPVDEPKTKLQEENEKDNDSDKN